MQAGQLSSTKKWAAALAIAGYVASIVAANWMTSTLGLVPIGFGLLVTAGTFAAGAALVLRDAVQQTTGKRTVIAAIPMAPRTDSKFITANLVGNLA